MDRNLACLAHQSSSIAVLTPMLWTASLSRYGIHGTKSKVEQVCLKFALYREDPQDGCLSSEDWQMLHSTTRQRKHLPGASVSHHSFRVLTTNAFKLR